MLSVGRVAITTGVLGYLAVWLITIPPVREILDSVPVVFAAWNAAAAVSALGLFVGWGLGIYHWGTRYTGERKSLWGVAVIPGAFLGALAYWWLAAERHAS